jgi:hypothetical protein
MQTNFLHFREHGKLTFTATAAQTNFTVKGATSLVPGTFGTGEGFATAIADTTDLRNNHKVTITSAAANTGNRGSDYTNANTTEGEVTVLEIEALSISSNDMVIANVSGDAQEGYDIKAGDIVTVELVPAHGTEGCFRADRLLSVHSNSDTETEITFQAHDGTAADDTVVLTHPDGNGAEFKLIADYIYELANANPQNSGKLIDVCDIQNSIMGKGLAKAGVTNMLVAIT